MAVEKKRRRAGGKLSRSETVTVRLDPKLRYLAELAARLHRRTLSSYIEWSIQRSVETEPLRPANGLSESTDDTFGNQAEALWDVEPADRFAKLALRYPHLLTHEEQVKWKLVRENGFVWRGEFSGHKREFAWRVGPDSLIFENLRTYWGAFCLAAERGDGQTSLPPWDKTEPNIVEVF